MMGWYIHYFANYYSQRCNPALLCTVLYIMSCVGTMKKGALCNKESYTCWHGGQNYARKSSSEVLHEKQRIWNGTNPSIRRRRVLDYWLLAGSLLLMASQVEDWPPQPSAFLLWSTHRLQSLLKWRNPRKPQPAGRSVRCFDHVG